MHIFIDESGDLGFNSSKRNTSKYFIVTLLMTDSKRSIEKVVRDIHKTLRKKYSIRNSLHAAHEEDITKIRFYKKVSLKSCKVAMMYLDKSKYKDKSLNKHDIYVNILCKLLTEFLQGMNESVITIIVSRREANRYLNTILVDKLMKSIRLKMRIEIKTPDQEKCLQAVDIMCWSFFRKYEHNDTSYSKLFKSIIENEYPYIP